MAEMRPVVWGVLSTARIGLDRVIPAMQASPRCEVRAIASRDGDRAGAAARNAGIPVAYGGYEALLADPAIEAVYNPLPNHLHLEWTRRAAEAGKHVLCEKPLTLDAAEAQRMIALRDRTGVLIEEAFVVRHHPQWLKARDLVRAGRIGRLQSMQASYSHLTLAPDDIRNRPEYGGGAIMDIGGYPTTLARFMFEAEPERVIALCDHDPDFGIDRQTSAILAFPGGGHASWTVSTQSGRYQGLVMMGTRGWIRLEVPFMPLPDYACRLHIGANEFPGPFAQEVLSLNPVNQYRLQGEAFSRAVRAGGPVAWPLETALANMKVLDALRRSACSGHWEAP